MSSNHGALGQTRLSSDSLGRHEESKFGVRWPIRVLKSPHTMVGIWGGMCVRIEVTTSRAVSSSIPLLVRELTGGRYTFITLSLELLGRASCAHMAYSLLRDVIICRPLRI